jgi:phosphatidylserine decarboxylase
VVDAIYSKGKFFNASLDKASSDNEQNAVIVKDLAGREYMFVQIAGLVARRIVSYVRAGKDVEIGRRMGLIKFGSRLDVYLPPEAVVVVQPRDRVKGGESILGRLK